MGGVRPSKDLALLEEIKSFFGVGKIYNKKDSVNFVVTSVKDLQIIRDHFNKYPLLSEKQNDFILWCKILEIVQKKEHNKMEGLINIVSLRVSLNKGLPEELKVAFPNLNIIDRPVNSNTLINDPNWLAGFFSGEACFLVSIFESNNLIGFAVRLRFNLIQHSRDSLLIKNLVDYLKCGRYVKAPEGYNHCEFIVSSLSEITENIIPFFEKFQIKGVKYLDFLDFCPCPGARCGPRGKVAQIMKNKNHLVGTLAHTKDGLEKIKLIKTEMNRNRKIE